MAAEAMRWTNSQLSLIAACLVCLAAVWRLLKTELILPTFFAVTFMLFDRRRKTRPLVELGFLGCKGEVWLPSTVGSAAGAFRTGKPGRIAEDFMVLRALG